ncbi:MAG: energy transducer TonB [Saprospiraceae bacterium]
MVRRGWLYGLIIFLAQTCNPYYSSNSNQNKEETISDPIEEEKIFRVVEDFPVPLGCELEKTNETKKICAEEKLQEYIYQNFVYPEMAKKNEIEGEVIIQFLLSKDGAVSQPQIVQDIGGGCGEEIYRVVNEMPKWKMSSAAKSMGEIESVQYILPVKFSIPENEKIKPKPRREGPTFKIKIIKPRFPGCEDRLTEEERISCSKEKMYAFIQKHLRYPPEAKDKGISGEVILHFFIEADGNIREPKLVLEPGGGCGAEAIRVIKMMPKWIPGKVKRNIAFETSVSILFE